MSALLQQSQGFPKSAARQVGFQRIMRILSADMPLLLILVECEFEIFIGRVAGCAHFAANPSRLVQRCGEIGEHGEQDRGGRAGTHRVRRRPVSQRPDGSRPEASGADGPPRCGGHRARRRLGRPVRFRRGGQPVAAQRHRHRHGVQPAKRRRQARRGHGRLLQAGPVRPVRLQHRDLPARGRRQGQAARRPARQGARKETVPDLKKADAKLNFVMQRFERHKRRVDPAAAQQLVAVLGDKTGELAAMCDQLCFDFDDDPIGIERINQYLTANPQVTGFAVADTAVAGRTAEAIVQMRAAVEQGTDPIALIGALAMKLRGLAKASAVRSGTISQAEAKMNPWVLKNSMRQLSGWTSAGLGNCIRMLAWADEQSKTNGGDPVYALERCIEAISHKGK